MDSHHQPPAVGRGRAGGWWPQLRQETWPPRCHSSEPSGPRAGQPGISRCCPRRPQLYQVPDALSYLNVTWADTETHPAWASCRPGDSYSRPPRELQSEVRGIWEVPCPAPHSCPLPLAPSCANHTLRDSQRKALGTKQPGRPPPLPCTSRWVVWTASPWMLYARQV